MTPGSEDELAEQLRALRLEYLADAAQRVAELAGLLARVEAGETDAPADLRRAFHRLAGSGGSYGFPVISSRSREGEHVAERLAAAGLPPAAPDLAELSSCIRDIGAAFDVAKRDLGT